jgi:hypothetical protein
VTHVEVSHWHRTRHPCTQPVRCPRASIRHGEPGLSAAIRLSPADNLSHSACEKKVVKHTAPVSSRLRKATRKIRGGGQSTLPFIFSLHSASFYTCGRGHGAHGNNSDAQERTPLPFPPPLPSHLLLVYAYLWSWSRSKRREK